MKKILSFLAIVMLCSLLPQMTSTVDAASHQYSRSDTSQRLFMSNGQQTPHFTVNDVRCDCRTSACPATFSFNTRVVDYMHMISEHFGRPNVNSGFRCPQHTESRNNPNSRHIRGEAVDLGGFSRLGVTPREAVRYAESIGISGIQLYSWGIHIDLSRYRAINHSNGRVEIVATFGGTSTAQTTQTQTPQTTPTPPNPTPTVNPETQIRSYMRIITAQQRFTTRDSAPIRERPYNDGSEIRRTGATGEALNVTGRGTNTRDNLWYSVEGGGWIYSGNISITRPPTASPTPNPTPAPTPAAPRTVTIHYNANGGTNAPSSHNVTSDANGTIIFTIPNRIPSRSDYTFEGWRLGNASSAELLRSGQHSIALAQVPSNNTLTYYAQWRRLFYGTATIRYNANGGTNTPLGHSTLIREGVASFWISDTIPVRNGYDFVGWRLENDPNSPLERARGGRIDINLSGDTTLTYFAQWTPSQVGEPPRLIQGRLPFGMVGNTYNATPPINGVGPFVWSISVRSLPPGLSINPQTGAITGTPTEAGRFVFFVRAENIAGSAEGQFSIEIDPRPVPPTFRTRTLPELRVGVSYGMNVACNVPLWIIADGEPWSFTFRIVSGELPPGIRILGSQGSSMSFQGTPTRAGTFNFTVRAENSAGFDERPFSITVRN
jgi:uncharacterized repeat protein (TIGR02543 family)